MEQPMKKAMTLQSILRLPDRGRSIPGNVLSDLMRSIWDSRKITDREHDRYTDRWVQKHYADNDKHRSSAKSNVNRALADPDMSYKTFMRGLGILPIRNAIFTVQIEWADGKITYHQATASDKDPYTDVDEIGGMKFIPRHRDEIDEDDYDPE